ncbi:hypothetical protein [Collimonas sp.]|jgi:hypothetical protein|uniref:hypothetical protein n=1 Tax=Collimonas sp. TaxID=1963772 RepID=UPI002CC4B24F|nr:hypothetical protein [Collimonas sp.]HWW08324.1 hypothetical protein [Collimonas sp.]
MSGGMATDLRGFVYPLASIQQRYQWQLDILQGQLGAIQNQMQAQQERLAEMRRQMALQTECIAKAVLQRLNPLAHQRSIAYLMQCSQQIKEQEKHLAALEEERQRLRRECIDQQQRLELTEQHRLDCLKEYTELEQIRQSNEADRDWIARSVWKERLHAQPPVKTPQLESKV